MTTTTDPARQATRPDITARIEAGRAVLTDILEQTLRDEGALAFWTDVSEAEEAMAELYVLLVNLDHTDANARRQAEHYKTAAELSREHVRALAVTA